MPCGTAVYAAGAAAEAEQAGAEQRSGRRAAGDARRSSSRAAQPSRVAIAQQTRQRERERAGRGPGGKGTPGRCGSAFCSSPRLDTRRSPREPLRCAAAAAAVAKSSAARSTAPGTRCMRATRRLLPLLLLLRVARAQPADEGSCAAAAAPAPAPERQQPAAPAASPQQQPPWGNEVPGEWIVRFTQYKPAEAHRRGALRAGRSGRGPALVGGSGRLASLAHPPARRPARAALQAALGHLGGWAWVDRANAAAAFPTDFGLARLSRAREAPPPLLLLFLLLLPPPSTFPLPLSLALPRRRACVSSSQPRPCARRGAARR